MVPFGSTLGNISMAQCKTAVSPCDTLAMEILPSCTKPSIFSRGILQSPVISAVHCMVKHESRWGPPVLWPCRRHLSSHVPECQTVINNSDIGTISTQACPYDTLRWREAKGRSTWSLNQDNSTSGYGLLPTQTGASLGWRPFCLRKNITYFIHTKKF